VAIRSSTATRIQVLGARLCACLFRVYETDQLCVLEIFGDVACCVCRAFACIAFPFQNQNTGETLASLDPLSVTTKATIYDSAHVLEKAMLLEKVPYQP